MRSWNKRILLTPVKHADWTFYPNKKTREKLGVEFKDVGLFIDSGEVILLCAIKPPRVIKNLLVICIKEGQIELKNEDWIEWKKSIKESSSIFDIQRILKEYESL